jgi:hypothetical protein
VEGGWLYALLSGHGMVTKFARAEFGIPGTPEPVSELRFGSTGEMCVLQFGFA